MPFRPRASATVLDNSLFRHVLFWSAPSESQAMAVGVESLTSRQRDSCGNPITHDGDSVSLSQRRAILNGCLSTLPAKLLPEQAAFAPTRTCDPRDDQQIGDGGNGNQDRTRGRATFRLQDPKSLHLHHASGGARPPTRICCPGRAGARRVARGPDHALRRVFTGPRIGCRLGVSAPPPWNRNAL